jgi:hypothetical protein
VGGGAIPAAVSASATRSLEGEAQPPRLVVATSPAKTKASEHAEAIGSRDEPRDRMKIS